MRCRWSSCNRGSGITDPDRAPTTVYRTEPHRHPSVLSIFSTSSIALLVNNVFDESELERFLSHHVATGNCMLAQLGKRHLGTLHKLSEALVFQLLSGLQQCDLLPHDLQAALNRSVQNDLLIKASLMY